MSYFAVWGISEDESVKADDVATTRGWAELILWAGERLDGAECPQLDYLCEHGECVPEADENVLAELERELAWLTSYPPDGMPADVRRTVKRLLGVVQDRPGGAVVLVITDGAESGDEDDEEEEDDD